MSLDTLSDEVGLSRNACWRRIKQLEESGIIRARVALLDPELLGLNLTVFIAIRAAQHSSDWAKTFSDVTRSFPEIQSVYRMTGELDYLIRARVRDMAAYDNLYKRLIEKVDLADVSASFVMEDIKDDTALPLFA